MTPQFPTTLYVDKDCIRPYTEEPWSDIEKDPRGLLLMWEPPIPGVTYKMAVDSTEGKTGWSRATRYDGDHKIDNGAIEIFRPNGSYELLFKEEAGIKIPDIGDDGRQKRLYKDVQVAEWAGPVDVVEIARIANVLGRIYAGSDEDQCQLILESWPGIGMLAMQELIRLQYGNMWHWEYFADGPAEQTQWVGWRTTDRSKRILWTRIRRHIMENKALIRSTFLKEEFSNAEIDIARMTARAASGYHDDRFFATCMCIWACHGWSYEVDSSIIPVTTTPVKDYQSFAPTPDENITFQDWKDNAVADWWD